MKKMSCFPAQGITNKKRKCEPLRLVLSKGSGLPAKRTRGRSHRLCCGGMPTKQHV